MIALGADHGGYQLKETIKKHLEERGIPFTRRDIKLETPTVEELRRCDQRRL